MAGFDIRPGVAFERSPPCTPAPVLRRAASRSLCVVVAITLAGMAATAWAQQTRQTLDTRWVYDEWSPEDGPGLSHFNGVYEAPDGSIWFTSYDGAARYDGARFERFRTSEYPVLPTNRYIDVAFQTDGTAWLTSEFGDVVRLRDGDFRVWPSDEAIHTAVARAFVFDDEVWIAERGVTRIVGDERVVVWSQDEMVESIVALDDGTLLLGTEGVVHIDREGRLLETVDVLPRERTHRLQFVEGYAWALGNGWVGRREHDGTWTRLERDCADTRDPAFNRVIGAGGHVLIRTLIPGGWWHVDGDRIVCRKVASEDLSGSGDVDADGTLWWVRDGMLYANDTRVLKLEMHQPQVFVDGSGAIWVATSGGNQLLRIRARDVHIALPTLDDSPIVDAVGTAPDGSVWVHGRDNRSYRYDSDGTLVEVSTVPLPEDARGHILYQSATLSDGRHWLLSSAGLCPLSGRLVRVEDGVRFTECWPVLAPPEVGDGFHELAMTEARDGALWVVSRVGIWRDLFGTPREVLGVTGESETHRYRQLQNLGDGRLVATSASGLTVIDPATDTARTLRTGDGLPTNDLRGFIVDGDALIVATGTHGLCRVDPDAPSATRCVDTRVGLPHDAILNVSLDDAGFVWCGTPQGLFAIRLGQLNLAFAGRTRHVLPVRLTERNGMIGRAVLGLRFARDGRGRLWIPTIVGAASFDPALLGAVVAPTPEITALVIDGAPRPFADGLHLARSERDLTVEWIAPDSRWSEQAVFRYRLSPYSDDWTYTRARSATWTNLPPGRSTFEVQAGLNGAWSEVEHVEIERQPRFMETLWAPVSGALGLSLLLGGLGAARVRRHRRRAAELEHIVDARTAELSAQNEWLAKASEALAERNDQIVRQTERLKELDHLKTRFVANVGHELRTPITLVLGALDALEEDDEPDLDRWAGLARANAERLHELIEQLMDVARVDSGDLPIRARHLDLVDVVEMLIDRLGAYGANRGVIVTLEAPDLVPAWIDVDLLDKVLGNLITNAIKHSPDDGEVTVILTPPDPDMIDPTATLAVQDQGPGVPPALRERLFERFYQADHGDDRSRDGIGIGLSLARDVAELLGGDLRVEDAVGGGARFVFDLPIGADHLDIDEIASDAEGTDHDAGALASAAASDGARGGDAAAASDGAGDGTSAGRTRPQLLVVEDNEDLRLFLADRLSREFDVVTARDGLEALAMVRSATPDVVLADVMMPRLDGIGFCTALREDSSIAHVPVMLLTAKTLVEDRLMGLQVANDYMTKPFDLREVAARLLNLVTLAKGGTLRPVAAQAHVDTRAVVDVDFESKLNAFVTKHASDPGLGVGRLARALALSERHFRREVRRITGKSPNAYVRDVRLGIADELLRLGQVSTVAEAAQAVGWTQSYFSRLYQQAYGSPPSSRLASRAR